MKIAHLSHFPKLIDVCAGWNHATWGAVTGKSLEDYKKTYQANLNDNKLPMTVVALDENQPVGMASLCPKDGCYTYSPFPDVTPWLVSLYVDPNKRKQGIGEKLIDFLKGEARKLGYDAMYLLAYDPKLPRWYEHLGWQYFGEDVLDGAPIILMKTILKQ